MAKSLAETSKDFHSNYKGSFFSIYNQDICRIQFIQRSCCCSRLPIIKIYSTKHANKVTKMKDKNVFISILFCNVAYKQEKKFNDLPVTQL